MQDRQILEQAQLGNKAAFDQLVKNWYPRIYNFGYKYFANHHEASEVSQKTFITVYTKLSQLKDIGKFRSWIYQIASNYCHEAQRKNRKRHMTSLAPPGENEEGQYNPSVNLQSSSRNSQGDHSLRENELKDLLRKALNMLKEEQRIVVIMKEYEGFKFSEIAEILKISENTAKSRLYYGLTKLKKIFNQWNITQENLNYES